jgi:hypothetical protein
MTLLSIKYGNLTPATTVQAFLFPMSLPPAVETVATLLARLHELFPL